VRRVIVMGLAFVVLSAVANASLASAATPSPWWHLTSRVRPATLPRGGEVCGEEEEKVGKCGDFVSFRALNLGDAPTATSCVKVKPGSGKYTEPGCSEEAEPGMGEFEKAPVTITATLPAGVTVAKVEVEPGKPEPKVSLLTFPESEQADPTTCGEPAPRRVVCTYEPALGPYEYVELSIAVDVAGNAVSGGTAVAEVSGGGAPAVKVERSLAVGEPGEAVPFAVEDESFSIVPEEEGGAVQAQAGSHPFQLTTNLALNQTADTLQPPALPKQLKFTLPAGLIGNAVAFPRCSELDFLTKGFGGFDDLCPEDTAIGVVDVTVHQPVFGAARPFQTYPIPVFNLTPKKGEPARFGFFFLGIPVPIDFSVRTGRDYGVTATVSSITQVADFLSETLTIWGVPGEAVHDASRGWGCVGGGFYSDGGQVPCTPADQTDPPPFLTLPTSCRGPWVTNVTGESWPQRSTPQAEATSIPLLAGEADEYALTDVFGRAIGITGCNQLPFSPFVEVAPDVQQASTPTGVAVTVRVPQEVSENALGLASSAVKDIKVAFPEGVTVNPASADGLEACTGNPGDAPASPGNEIGFTGFAELDKASEPGVKTATFSPRLPGSADALEAGEGEPLRPGTNFCPDASKLGTVKIKIPVIAHPLEGALYLATPAPNGEEGKNPFNSLLATYIVAEDPESGVLIKLAGEVSLNEATGQITSTFDNSPQGPLEEAEIHLFGGARGPFATPARCGTYTTNALFAPWSGREAIDSSSSFEITSGPNGGPCPAQSLPFAPSLQSGTTNINAGAFSPLETTLGREDGNQGISSVVLRYPPGVSGLLTGVKLCAEAQANTGTCGPESLIGHTTVSVGLGNEPYSVTGGEVFLTETYEGAPFGLSIVNPAVAGPFNLGKVIVRATVEVDPHTAALTVTTNSQAQGYAIPHMLRGIPLQIKHVNVTIDRPGFTFNPTNCSPMRIEGTISGDEGASSPVSDPFQATNCANLGFAPKFAASTSGKTSKAYGASLSVKLVYPTAPFGSQANIAKVKVDLPKQLPSRLTTLQKACTAKQFNADPAGCPAESIVGHARAITPLLPVPLEGPAYFVSNGGEAFPNLIMVLQGYGVTVDLVGDTFIDKAGITSSTFRSVPDAPVGSFELTLPEGKFSALAANGNLCTSKLAMPTAFVAQNGATIHTSTPIDVTGCKKTLTDAQKLAAALKACHKGKKAGRASCERQARRRYGPAKTKKKGSR
jgi:hypothetical protein